MRDAINLNQEIVQSFQEEKRSTRVVAVLGTNHICRRIAIGRNTDGMYEQVNLLSEVK